MRNYAAKKLIALSVFLMFFFVIGVIVMTDYSSYRQSYSSEANISVDVDGASYDDYINERCRQFKRLIKNTGKLYRS